MKKNAESFSPANGNSQRGEMNRDASAQCQTRLLPEMGTTLEGGGMMIAQCFICKRIRMDGEFRLPWPGELKGRISEVYCPHCAKEALARIQAGEFAFSSSEFRKVAGSG